MPMELTWCLLRQLADEGLEILDDLISAFSCLGGLQVFSLHDQAI